MTLGHRLTALDAFRGMTMIWMFSEGFGLAVFHNDAFWGPLARQFDHAEWNGANAWDMIQPFFMFIVGAAMPFAFAKRLAAGETWAQGLRPVLRRSALLIIFGLIARSVQAQRPVLDLINVLAQIAFTYFLAYLVIRLRWGWKIGVAFGLLVLHWGLYQLGPYPGFEKNANFGWYLDGVMLGKHWSGGYATINCLSSAANTIFGLIAGQLLFSRESARRKLTILVNAGCLSLAVGLYLSAVIPINKKIWTAPFALYSTGWTLLVLAAFYWICDVLGYRRWATVFTIVGANSIFIYLFHEIFKRPMHWATKPLLQLTAQSMGLWSHVFVACVLVALQIALCFLLYRRGIFLRV